MKMPRDRDREVKLEKNSREFSRNETLAHPSFKGALTGHEKRVWENMIFVRDSPRLSKKITFQDIWLGKFVWAAYDFGYINLANFFQFLGKDWSSRADTPFQLDWI